MFENLTNKFEEIFSSLKKSPSLDEAQVDEGLRGIRQALLEADVSLEVAKDFIEKIKPKALGQEIIRSTSPGDMVVKIVYDELVSLLGEANSDINLNAVPPVPMMLVGLQGSGKTTTTAKLAKYSTSIFLVQSNGEIKPKLALSIVTLKSVSYTHLTLPTICSV